MLFILELYLSYQVRFEIYKRKTVGKEKFNDRSHIWPVLRFLVVQKSQKGCNQNATQFLLNS